MRIHLCVQLVGALMSSETGTIAATDTANTVEVHTGNFPFYSYAKQYDIWNFTPLDQGGRLIQLQLIFLDTHLC